MFANICLIGSMIHFMIKNKNVISFFILKSVLYSILFCGLSYTYRTICTVLKKNQISKYNEIKTSICYYFIIEVLPLAIGLIGNISEAI